MAQNGEYFDFSPVKYLRSVNIQVQNLCQTILSIYFDACEQFTELFNVEEIIEGVLGC
jgi:hypothetical protein